MKFTEEIEKRLVELFEEKNIALEGNILKVIETDSDTFREYIAQALENDKSNRKKRLEITKQVQDQNKQLAKKAEENEHLILEVKEALEQAEKAKKEAMEDLDLLHKKTQYELINNIVKVALWIIMGVGVITTVMYGIALFTKIDTTLLGNTWSNLFGILLTNSFSIIGTIMGVKYASNDENNKNKNSE